MIIVKSLAPVYTLSEILFAFEIYQFIKVFATKMMSTITNKERLSYLINSTWVKYDF